MLDAKAYYEGEARVGVRPLLFCRVTSAFSNRARNLFFYQLSMLRVRVTIRVTMFKLFETKKIR